MNIRRVATAGVLGTAVLLSACTSSTSPPDRSEPPPGAGVSRLSKSDDMAALRGGRYEAWRIGSPVTYEVDVPDGWRSMVGTFINAPTDGHGIFFVASLPKHRTQLAVHPCRDHTLWTVGPTVQDFVRAMRAQPVWQVSRPEPASIDGNDALYVEVELPASVDPARCVDGAVSEYESGADGMATERSYKGRWWILEAHGERLVVMARCYDTCSEQDLDTMSAMAESISFTA